jgi:predicted DNA binding protein
MREVTLRVRHRDAPESDVTADYPEITYRSTSSMTGTGRLRKRIVELSGPTASIESFIEDFRASEAVTQAELLTDANASRVFMTVAMDIRKCDPITELIMEMGVHFRNGTTINAGWEQWTVYLDDGDDLQEIVSAIEGAGNDVEIARTVPLDDIEAGEHLEFSQVLYELTPRQREVLSAAIRMGYYQPRKDTTIEEIGDAIGVAPTTAWEHLARAERKVMEEIGDHLCPES